MESSDKHPPDLGHGVFLTTHWSMVLDAGGDHGQQAQEALSKLCHIYWLPLYSYIRRRGHSVHDAQDLTQSFFEHLLSTETISRAQQDRGRFRNFLLTALRRFLINAHHARNTMKRGRDFEFVKLDHEDIERKAALDKSQHLSPERMFDKAWAKALIDEVIRKLESESSKGQSSTFVKACIPMLLGEHAAYSIKELAQQHNMSEGAAKVAIHRLRTRYRNLLRQEIAQTLSSNADLDEEIRYLASLLSE